MSETDVVVALLLGICALGGVWEVFMMTCRTDKWIALKRHAAEEKRRNRQSQMEMFNKGARSGLSIVKRFMK